MISTWATSKSTKKQRQEAKTKDKKQRQKTKNKTMRVVPTGRRTPDLLHASRLPSPLTQWRLGIIDKLVYLI
jgi:hypothetical protein